MSGTFYDDIDKLPPLSKYEYYLQRTTPCKEFDRQREEIQNAGDLYTIRNKIIAHPKVKERSVQTDGIFFAAQIDKIEHLKIPNSIDAWTAPNAVVALRVITAFLDYFFRELCEFSPDHVFDILLSSSEYTEKRGTLVFYAPQDWIDAQNKWKLRLQFLGVQCSQTKNK